MVRASGTASAPLIRSTCRSTGSSHPSTSSRSPPTARYISATSGLRLPAQLRDLTIDYTALSLVAPEKVRFRFKLEGQDPDWREVRQHSPRAVFEPCTRQLPLSCHRRQQQRRLERGRRVARFFHRPRVLADELVSRAVRGRVSSHCCGRCIGCGCGSWRGSSNGAWRRASPSARASRAICTTRCCRAFKGCCCAFRRSRELLPTRPAEAEQILDERDRSDGAGHHRGTGSRAGVACLDGRDQ